MKRHGRRRFLGKKSKGFSRCSGRQGIRVDPCAGLRDFPDRRWDQIDCGADQPLVQWSGKRAGQWNPPQDFQEFEDDPGPFQMRSHFPDRCLKFGFRCRWLVSSVEEGGQPSLVDEGIDPADQHRLQISMLHAIGRHASTGPDPISACPATPAVVRPSHLRACEGRSSHAWLTVTATLGNLQIGGDGGYVRLDFGSSDRSDNRKHQREHPRRTVDGQTFTFSSIGHGHLYGMTGVFRRPTAATHRIGKDRACRRMYTPSYRIVPSSMEVHAALRNGP